MKIGIHDADEGTVGNQVRGKYPNLALMKISAFYKLTGNTVKPFIPLEKFDIVFASKVFAFKREKYTSLPKNTIRGGTGYGLYNELPDVIEHTCPDYSMTDNTTSFGFTTRGCIRNCPWCVVPKKEGPIHAHADLTEFVRHRNVILMDNNILACDHGIEQLGKAAKLDLKIDVNQGMDARLIDANIARRLAKCRWLKPIRLACDTSAMMPTIEHAVKRLREAGATPSRYSCYVLLNKGDIDDALERCRFLDGLGVDPFVQPYRDIANPVEPSWLERQFARYVNRKQLFKSCTWNEYIANQNQKRRSA